MAKIFFTLFLIATGNILFAQYVHYSDKRNINNTKAAETISPKLTQDPNAKVIRDTVKVVVKDTVKVVVKDTVKVMVKDTLKIVVHDTLKVIVSDTINGLTVAPDFQVLSRF